MSAPGKLGVGEGEVTGSTSCTSLLNQTYWIFFKVCSWFLYFFCLPLCPFVARRQIFLITLQLNRKLMLKIDQKHFRLELGKMVVQGFDVSKICLF